MRTPRGDIAVYVAHLPSVRVGWPSGFGSGRRDESAGLLGAAIAAEKLDTVILLGDLNGTVDDRGLAPVTSRMSLAERRLRLQLARGFPHGPDRPGHGPLGDRHRRPDPARHRQRPPADRRAGPLGRGSLLGWARDRYQGPAHPPARGPWRRLGTRHRRGQSGAAVFRSADGSRYGKCVPAHQVAALEAERDRVEWLDAQGVPGARVLDWRVTDAGGCLLTSAVAGVPADRVPAATLRAAWEPIADSVRRLHDLPPRACPFGRDLCRCSPPRARSWRGARSTRSSSRRPAAHPTRRELLARLAPQVEARLAQEAAEAVVCHGDLCLPNIVLDPTTLTVAGFIDLGRLGRADPYADIALLLATARETWPDERQANAAEALFAHRYGTALDRDRERFYLHLDPLTWG